MAAKEQKVKKVIAQSKEVFADVSVANGGIVAANTDQAYYPRRAANYHFVWPRDAAFVCVASELLGMKISEPFFNWLNERPEDFVKEGLLYQRYATNGRKEGKQFQPDQAGSILWAIYTHFKENPEAAKKHEVLIRRLADGLCSNWKGKYFFTNTCDLWEEGHRKTSTKMENNFTYSLAACAHGLNLADRLVHDPHWVHCAKEMRQKIDEAYNAEKGYFLRNKGKISDPNVDASLVGLVYPTESYEADDERLVKTVAKIEEKIVQKGGVHRFEMDYYDGEGSGDEGGGAWPLLNFWLSIYYSILGNKKKAAAYYFWVLDRLPDDNLIPEQIFDDFREGIKPLAWSHAMFVLASHHLGYL